MSNKSKKTAKASLTAADREIGKQRIFILLGMIVLGLAVAIYNMQ